MSGLVFFVVFSFGLFVSLFDVKWEFSLGYFKPVTPTQIYVQSSNPDVFSEFRNPCIISKSNLDFGPFKQNQKRLVEIPGGGGGTSL